MDHMYSIAVARRKFNEAADEAADVCIWKFVCGVSVLCIAAYVVTYFVA